MRARTYRTALLALAVLAFLPVADGGQAECWNAATSLTSTAVGAVNGDESFFKSPTGPSNVMFLLDVSGSMDNFPQCGDSSWSNSGSTSGKCRSPALAAPATPTSANPVAYTGTCHPSTINPDLAWMEKVIPQDGYADPGRTNALLTDKPPWGTGCAGDACMFDPKAYYNYSAWWASSGGAGAYRRAHDTDTNLNAACTAFSSGGTTITRAGVKVVLGQDCLDCMRDHGFFFYRLKVYENGGVTDYPSTVPMFKGTFLNANPPKFVTARKVVKDIAWMDPSAPSKLDQVRLGLTIIDPNEISTQTCTTYVDRWGRTRTSCTTNWERPVRQARLIVPLGPDKPHAFSNPPSQENFRQARQYLLSAINYDQGVYTNASSQTIVDGRTITSGFFNPANGSTPLGSALFNVGQYISSKNQYASLLGSSDYQTPAFEDSASGDTKAAWADGTANQCTVCWSCQKTSVVVVTDGAPNSEMTLPGFPTGISNLDSTVYNSSANCGAAGGCNGSILPRVASWLRQQDLRADFGSIQPLTVHTVGINITLDYAVNTLRATANMGGGIFQNAEDPKSLADAVFNAVNMVAATQNSFTATSAASLQTVQTSSMQAFLTRFKPTGTTTWEGHVQQTFLFDERMAGCDPESLASTVTCGGKQVPVDFNGDGSCSGVFMIDKDCDRLEENADGELVKMATSIAGNIAWDAGAVLSDPTKPGYKSADEDDTTNGRKIFTVIAGVNEPVTAANAAKLLPYLNIGAGWCNAFLTRLGITPTAGTERLTCAKELIYFVRGWDTLDQDADKCTDPGRTNATTCPSGVKGEERDRVNDGNSTADKVFWKLGDIFHSSPASMTAPIQEMPCATAAENQCVMTLFSSPTLPDQTPIEMYPDPDDSTLKIDAYEAYRKANLKRKRVIFAGSNDGMFHAFEAGDLAKVTPAQYVYSDGTGTELWAFIPPDMLPRLKDLVDTHQYMVDGSPMLRDVWVDGSGSEVGAADGKKQKDEFHTIVVFGRRSGGTAWSALDVTNPDSPKQLWSFPDPTTGDDARYMGESWSEFAPKPPPIGPVRLASATDPRKFEERWIVMINGGYDPMLNFGRAVFMVDAWTGKTLWRITDPDWRAQLASGTNKLVYGGNTAMFPVTAAIGLVDIGSAVAGKASDGFFDTATWGDLGGNLFVARFHEPGKIGSSGRVENWNVARAFEEQRRTDDAMLVRGRSEFFFMTANAWNPASGSLRTLLGSGNRERITANSATCGTDNLFGCCQAGGNITSRSTMRSGTCEQSSTFSCMGDYLSFVATTGGSCGAVTCASPGAGNTSAYHNVTFYPPGLTAAAQTGTAWWDGSGLVTVNPMPSVEYKSSSFRAQTKSRFYGVWAYGGDRTFTDPDSAVSFERQRLTDVAYASICKGPANKSCTLVNTSSAQLTPVGANPLVYTRSCRDGTVSKCQATTADPGWYYEYGDYCPLGDGKCSETSWTDEKTGAPAGVIGGCLLYSSFRPVGGATSTSPCEGSAATQIAYDYTLDYRTGTPIPGTCGGRMVAATKRSLRSPPSAGNAIYELTPSGRMEKGLLNADGNSSSKTTISSQSSAAEPLYWIEVSRDEHACRHAATGAAACK